MQTICCNFIIVTLGTGQINFIDFIFGKAWSKKYAILLRICPDYYYFFTVRLSILKATKTGNIFIFSFCSTSRLNKIKKCILCVDGGISPAELLYFAGWEPSPLAEYNDQGFWL